MRNYYSFCDRLRPKLSHYFFRNTGQKGTGNSVRLIESSWMLSWDFSDGEGPSFYLVSFRKIMKIFSKYAVMKNKSLALL